MCLLLAVLFLFVNAVCADDDATFRVSFTKGPLVPINPDLLTGFTIDVCALKNGFNFSNNTYFRTLTQNLAPTILRIGGTDQNNYLYNNSDDSPVQLCRCSGHCTMTRPYWDSIRAFAQDLKLQLIFGLAQNVSNAQELIKYTASDEHFTALFAYTWGNEITGDHSFVEEKAHELSQIRQLLADAYSNNKTAPLLVAPDTGVGPRKGTVPANVSKDGYINGHLDFIADFVQSCSKYIDALSWHTYDYRTST